MGFGVVGLNKAWYGFANCSKVGNTSEAANDGNRLVGLAASEYLWWSTGCGGRMARVGRSQWYMTWNRIRVIEQSRPSRTLWRRREMRTNRSPLHLDSCVATGVGDAVLEGPGSKIPFCPGLVTDDHTG